MRPADTSPEAWKLVLDLQRKMTPEQKIRNGLAYSTQLRNLACAMIRQNYPAATDREIFLREARQRLGAELFYRVYGEELADERPDRAGR
jgi:hypothetical protein